jgi:LEA14-like dessication related protein
MKSYELKIHLIHKIRISTLIISISTFLLLPSCRIVKEPEFRRIEKIRLSQIGLSESTLTAELVYFNPNKFGYKIRSFEADIEVNNRLLGRTASNSEINVAKMTSFRVPVELKVNMGNLPLNSWNLLTKDSITFKATGSVMVGMKGIYKPVRINYKGKQKVEW